MSPAFRLFPAASLLSFAAWTATAALLAPPGRQSLQVRFPGQGQTTSTDDGRDVLASVPHYNRTAILRLAATLPIQDEADVRLPPQAHPGQQPHLVWVTRQVVDATLEAQDAASTSPRQWEEHLRQSLATAAHQRGASRPRAIRAQVPFALTEAPQTAHPTGPDEAPVVLQTFSSASALLSVPPSRLSTLDLHLPRFTQAFLLSTTPPSRSVEEKQTKEPAFPQLLPSANIARLLRSHHLAVPSLNQTATTLSGEDQSSVPPEKRWTSRHSATYGSRMASEWILGQMREALSKVDGARCELEEYGQGNFSPNVVCIVPGNEGNDDDEEDQAGYEEGAILLSAHYDSRGSFGKPRAPGGNDDGSGTTMLLAISRILAEEIATEQETLRSQTRRDESPPSRRREVQLVFFSGEEQGLVGSKKYASSLAASLSEGSKVYSPSASTLYRSTSLRLALQTDMIAFQSPSEPVQMAFPDRLATASATKYLWSTAQLYVPELLVGYTPACCSDHQSFWEAGYPATWVFERNGPILDDKYHNSGDTVLREGYSVEKIGLIGQVVLASAVGLIWE